MPLGRVLPPSPATPPRPGHCVNCAARISSSWREKSGEGTGLAIEDRGEVLYVDHVGSSSPVQIRDWSGTRYPHHTVATGFRPDVDLVGRSVGRLTPQQEWSRSPGKPVTSLTALRKKMRIVRSAGAAWTRTEFSDEIIGVSAPIIGSNGDAIGALSIYGPAWRFPGDRDEAELESLVRDATGSVSSRLAH